MKLIRTVKKYNEGGCHINLPADVCKQMNLFPGVTIAIDYVDGKIVIEKVMESNKCQK